MSGPRLVGVGVGPGQPDLVTVRAVDVLRAADLVVVPVQDLQRAGRAERVVRHHVDHDRVRRLHFALDEQHDRDRRERAWDVAGREVADALAPAADAMARTVAFATIGDPNVYSTFSYLAATVRALVPGLVVETVPGITAMQLLASVSGTPLVEGEESLTLYPLTAGLPGYRDALSRSDTVVAYKGGRHLPQVLAALREQGRCAVVGTDLGLPGERVVSSDQVDDDRVPYMSTVLSVPADRTRGGRL